MYNTVRIEYIIDLTVNNFIILFLIINVGSRKCSNIVFVSVLVQSYTYGKKNPTIIRFEQT